MSYTKLQDLLTPTLDIEVQYDKDGNEQYICHARVLGHCMQSEVHTSKFDAEAEAAERLYYLCLIKLHKRYFVEK